MTAAQLADKLLSAEHADVVRESVAWMVAELMEAEVTAQIGAEYGERSPERTAQRNGHRTRAWETVGDQGRGVGGRDPQAADRLVLSVVLGAPSTRRAGVGRGRPGGLQEAYVNGVSTRRVDRLVEQLGIAGMSKDQVSRLCRGLDEQVRAFRERPLEGRYPSLWLDAKIERVREPGGVRTKALVIAYGVHETGRREVIGLDVGEAETEAFWREFLRGLRARGLSGVRLCISDAHQGLRQAIAKVLGCPWQRCTVHFLRDMLGHVAKAQQPMIAAAIRSIFQATSLAEARARLVEVIGKLATTAPKVAGLLEAAEADLLAFYELPREHWSKLRSTNPLERVNREIGRRTDVVGIFPNDAALIRLAGAMLVEQNDEWLIARRYLSQESLELVLDDGPATQEVAQLTPA
jgi:putative transposase